MASSHPASPPQHASPSHVRVGEERDWQKAIENLFRSHVHAVRPSPSFLVYLSLTVTSAQSMAGAEIREETDCQFYKTLVSLRWLACTSACTALVWPRICVMFYYARSVRGARPGSNRVDARSLMFIDPVDLHCVQLLDRSLNAA